VDALHQLLASLFVALIILPVLVVQILERRKEKAANKREGETPEAGSGQLNTRQFFNDTAGTV
jgi:hydrophobic/amphiphilic exporter-1 (mainly G- bacteria), HAE1 family